MTYPEKAVRAGSGWLRLRPYAYERIERFLMFADKGWADRSADERRAAVCAFADRVLFACAVEVNRNWRIAELSVRVEENSVPFCAPVFLLAADFRDPRPWGIPCSEGILMDNSAGYRSKSVRVLPPALIPDEVDRRGTASFILFAENSAARRFLGVQPVIYQPIDTGVKAPETLWGFAGCDGVHLFRSAFSAYAAKAFGGPMRSLRFVLNLLKTRRIVK